MADVDKPYGFRPYKLRGQQSQNHGMTEYRIANNYGYAILNGDPVILVNDGTIARFKSASGAAEATNDWSNGQPVGVFMGCSYTDPTSGQKVWRNYYPASIAKNDIVAYVCDDPDMLFMVKADTDALAVADMYRNAGILQEVASADRTATGISGLSLAVGTLNTTNTLPLKIVEVIKGLDVDFPDKYVDVVVKFLGTNPIDNTTGI